jgi:hypothetical protein
MRHDQETGAFHLSKDGCRALLAFASQDQTRAHIACVHFDPGNGVACATDGHTMLRARNCGRSAHREAFSVPRDAFEQASRMLRKAGDELVVSGGGAEVVLRAHGERSGPLGELRCRPVDGQFPPYNEVVPSAPPTRAVPVIGMNGDYLARIALVQRAAESHACRLMLPADDLSPAVIETEGRSQPTTWTAVIMPCRV